MVFQDNTVEIPPEVDEEVGNPKLESWYGYLQRIDPFTIYLWHLKDYLAQDVKTKVRERVANGEDSQKAYKKEVEKALEIYKGAVASKGLSDLPMMPYYEESKGVEGETVRFQQSQVMRKQAAAKDIMLSGVNTPAGRRKLAQAVQNRDITEEEAYQLNPDWQTYRVGEEEKQQADIESLKENVNTPAGRWKLAVAVSKGVLSSLEAYDQNPYWQHYAKEESDQEALDRENLLRYGAGSTQGRMKLEQEVRAGGLSQEQAFGPGSQWEKWQHKQAEAGGAPPSPPPKGGVPTMTSEGLYKSPSGVILGPGERTINPTTGEVYTAPGETGAAGRVGLGGGPGKTREQLSREFESEMEQFRRGKLNPLGIGTPEQKLYDEKMWKQYGDFYGQYRNFLAGLGVGQMSDYRTIEQWTEGNPIFKEWERRSANQPSAPPPVYRRR